MQTQKKNPQQAAFQGRIEELTDFVQHTLHQQPTPDQQHYAALRLWLLDHEYHFSQLRNDCVNVMVFIGKQMAEMNDELTRRKHFVYMETMAGLYEFFEDALTNQLGIDAPRD